MIFCLYMEESKGAWCVDMKNIGNLDFGALSSEEVRELGFNVLFQEEDGTYDWIYSLKMLQNRSLINFILKIIAIMFLLIAVISAFIVDDFSGLLWFLGILALCFAGVILITYFATWLVNTLYKGNYLLVFQMNEKELVFSQTTDQAQVTRIISAASAAVNAASHNVGGTIAGAGLALSPNAYRSEFAKVKSIKGKRKDNLIWVNSFLQYQMVYVPDAFYDFVWNYITQRCPNARISER